MTARKKRPNYVVAPIIPSIQQGSLEKMAADLARLQTVDSELHNMRVLCGLLLDRLGGDVMIDKAEFQRATGEVDVIDRGMVVEFRVKK